MSYNIWNSIYASPCPFPRYAVPSPSAAPPFRRCSTKSWDVVWSNILIRWKSTVQKTLSATAIWTWPRLPIIFPTVLCRIFPNSSRKKPECHHCSILILWKGLQRHCGNRKNKIEPGRITPSGLLCFIRWSDLSRSRIHASCLLYYNWFPQAEYHLYNSELSPDTSSP